MLGGAGEGAGTAGMAAAEEVGAAAMDEEAFVAIVVDIAGGGEAAEEADAAPGTKTAGDGAGEAAGAGEPPEEPPEAPPQPAGDGGPRAEGVPNLSTEVPGSGNATSTDSVVAQPLPMLATNILGSFSKADWSRWRTGGERLTFFGAVMLTGAQFMYISRLPTLLNQVHARVASPVGRSVGIVNG